MMTRKTNSTRRMVHVRATRQVSLKRTVAKLYDSLIQRASESSNITLILYHRTRQTNLLSELTIILRDFELTCNSM